MPVVVNTLVFDSCYDLRSPTGHETDRPSKTTESTEKRLPYPWPSNAYKKAPAGAEAFTLSAVTLRKELLRLDQEGAVTNRHLEFPAHRREHTQAD